MNRVRRAVTTTFRDTYDRIALHLSAHIELERNAELFVVLYKMVQEGEEFVRYPVSFTDPVLLEDNHISWLTDIQVNYYFERAQRYVAQIREYSPSVSRDDFVRAGDNGHFDDHPIFGETEFRLSKLMTLNPANGIRELSLLIRETSLEGAEPSTPHRHGTLMVRGDIVAEPNDFVKWDLSIKNLPSRNALGSTVFNQFPHAVLSISKSNDTGDFAEVWWSNPSQVANANYFLGTSRVAVSVLNNADLHKPIKFTVYDHHNQNTLRIIGEVETTLYEILLKRQLTILKLTPADEAYQTHRIPESEECGIVSISNVVIEKESCFPQYIVGGCQIALTVGIDFTLSNGDLHRVYPVTASGRQRLNPYEHAITEVGKILESYDSDKRYPVYGFGARLPENGRFGVTQHNFPLHPNGVEVHRVEGILRVYREYVKKVKLDGPTLYAPILQQALQEVEKQPCTQEHQKYHILMILTDDPNGDVESTLRLLIRSSEMPISIIFIGIGNSDFSNFNRYLAKTDSDGRKEYIAFDNHRGVRDNVLFFKFNDLLENGDLAGEILRSIPEQFLEFMKQNRISPNC